MTGVQTCALPIFIEGYPGKYIVLARRHGDTWYVAAVNAGSEPLKLKFDLDMFAGKQCLFIKMIREENLSLYL